MPVPQFGNVTPARFQIDYPEFDNAGDYPPSSITYLLNMASLLFTTGRWDTTPGTVNGLSMQDIGVELFIAHNLVIEKMANDAARNGAAPGLSQGPVSSKGVGPVSISYDTMAALEPGAGHWNLTTYGTRLAKLMSWVGAGPVIVNVGPCGGGFLAVSGWAGPLPWPLPSGTGFSS